MKLRLGWEIIQNQRQPMGNVMKEAEKTHWFLFSTILQNIKKICHHHDTAFGAQAL